MSDLTAGGGVRLNTAIVIATTTLALGLILGEFHLWLPTTVAAAGVIDLLTRPWTSSSRLGANARLSIAMKLALSCIGLYAALGQLACIGLLVWWLIT